MSKERVVSDSVVVNAPAADIFELLARPSRHAEIDGSGSVVAATKGPERVSLGDRFGMDMRIVVPYKISNEVVEFEEGRRIAWRHFGHHVWRYELEPVDADTTKVTESFDWGVARVPRFYEIVGYPAKHKANIAKTLERLAAVFADN